MSAPTTATVAQLWVTLRSDDPAAVSALAVARARLAAGRTLRTLRRFRLFELAGALPARAELETLLHRSTQFYNPHKEAGSVRLSADEAAPVAPGEVLVRVVDRGAERRDAAERWWRHQTGETIEVREAVVWALGFESEPDPLSTARELARVEDRRHGLLCNPHAQSMEVAAESISLPWIGPDPR